MALEAEVSIRALALLRGWSGFPVLDRLLQDLPDTSVCLAGGVLRDAVLRAAHIPKDFDLFIGGSQPDYVLARLSQEGRISVGPFGSPRWFPAQNGAPYADAVPIRSFSNGLWQCEDIVDVLNQFDFTCNAIAVDIRTGRVFDPQNGLRALTRRVMQLVRFDYPEEPILPGHKLTRNAVLWFRTLHYAAARDLKIEPLTLQWLRLHREYKAVTDIFENTFFSLDQGFLRPLDRHA